MISVPPEAGGAREARQLTGDERVGRRHARQRPRRRGARLVAGRQDDRLRAHHARRSPTSGRAPTSRCRRRRPARRARSRTRAPRRRRPATRPTASGSRTRRPTIRRAGRTGEWIRVAPSDGGEGRDLPPLVRRRAGAGGLVGRRADALLHGGERRLRLPLRAERADRGDPHADGDGQGLERRHRQRARNLDRLRAADADGADGGVRLARLAVQARRASPDVNAGLPKHPLGETRVITWTGDKGETIEGLLTLPVGYAGGAALSAAAGRPRRAGRRRTRRPRSSRPARIRWRSFAAEGYAVLRANPRGSSGYGTKFR